MTASPEMPLVRRLEAVGFRAWPAAEVAYDGSWLIRLTECHDSRRLNSVNPLDPSDSRDIAARLEKASRRFADYGRQLTVRQTPLTPPALIAHMNEAGWQSFAGSIVMIADIPPNESTDSIEHLPTRDIGRFVDARVQICPGEHSAKAALTEIIGAIKPEIGLFVFEDTKIGPSAISLAVHDNDLAGLLQVAVAPEKRGQGIATAIVQSSLRWARLRGARQAWLAVETGNQAARGLYAKFGFREVYRYVYRRPGE
nr:GNAT family N-acetyltransferase [Pararhizobium capsulatum]